MSCDEAQNLYTDDYSMAVIELQCKGSKQADASKQNLTIALGVSIPVILIVGIASSLGYWFYRRKKVHEGQNR